MKHTHVLIKNKNFVDNISNNQNQEIEKTANITEREQFQTGNMSADVSTRNIYHSINIY